MKRLMLYAGLVIVGLFKGVDAATSESISTPMVSPNPDLLFHVLVYDSDGKHVAGATCTIYRRKVEDNTETKLYSRDTSPLMDLGEGKISGADASFAVGLWPPNKYTFIVRCEKDGKKGSYEFTATNNEWAFGNTSTITLE